MDDRCEIYGSGGFTRADLLRESALLTCSEPGYGYGVEKAATTKGYTFTMFEEIWTYGFPQEMQHFVHCARGAETPLETGEDGREVLKIMYAAYESAGAAKRIDWPYQSRRVTKPIDLWHDSACGPWLVTSSITWTRATNLRGIRGRGWLPCMGLHSRP